MKEIAFAINSVMNEVNGVAKNMTVGSGTNSYKWVSDKDVKQTIRESMIKNGLSILPTGITTKVKMDRWEEADPYKVGQMKTKQSIFTEVETKYILLHESGEFLELCGYGQGVDTQDKGAGKATTYALKNTLLNMFLIPTWVDTDNTHSDEYDVPPKKTYQQAEADDKEWMKEEDFAKLALAKDKFTDWYWAVRVARSKYKVSKEMEERIKSLFFDETDQQTKFRRKDL